MTTEQLKNQKKLYNKILELQKYLLGYQQCQIDIMKNKLDYKKFDDGIDEKIEELRKEIDNLKKGL